MRILQYILPFVAIACWGCTTYSESDWNPSSDADDVVEWMDDNLCYYYLYNSEYKELTRDLTLSYDTFLGQTLTQLEPNLDYKDGSIYSYIYRTSYVGSLSTTRISESKYLEYSYGLAAALFIEYTDGSYGIGVAAVYPDSPMYEAGVRRGDIITKVNGISMRTLVAFNTFYSELYYYPSTSDEYDLTLEDGRTILDVKAEYIYCNPILQTSLYGEDSKVGYLSYFSFDMAYDSELLEAISEFKSAGVTDLILDMRLNGGGYVNTANKLATAIAGDNSTGKVFAYYQYNSDRGGKTQYFYSTSTINSSQRLGLTRLYCLVDGFTASASELVINTLQGIDVDVYLIGQSTEGKNVAMELLYETFNGYEYEFAPISILLSNAKRESDYSAGFTPDYNIDPWGYSGSNFVDFTEEEPLISAALQHISTGDFPSTITATTRSSSPLKTMGKIEFSPSRKSGNLVKTEE